MDESTLVYLSLYLASVASIAVVAATSFRYSRESPVRLTPGRLVGLARDEAARLKGGGPVFLMHLSIALGVGVSIAAALVEPALGEVPVLRDVILAVSVPLLAGLAAALVWRVQRLYQSKRIEGSLLKTDRAFSLASTWLQLTLVAAIGMTMTELALTWAPSLAAAGLLVGTARNLLVAVYYVRPGVNLAVSYDAPLSSMSSPFKLGDVLEGRYDISQVKVGAGKMGDFDARERSSYDSCVEIGACEASCPATAAGRPLSPRVLVRKLSRLGKEESGADSDPLTAVGEDELWSCTSCGACVSSCPVGVRHLDIVYDLRRELVGRGKLDREKSSVLENLARTQNPYGLKASARGDWASEADVDVLGEGGGAEYLYWVGCVSSYDQRAQRISLSLAKVLKGAGVSFAILGEGELCTGDPARRLGEEGRFQELAYQNIQRLGSLGVKKIVASCPHCFNSLKNDYPAFGGKYEVVYYTQLLSDLVKEGRIRLPEAKVREISVTLHDACYAARYNNIFDEPRAALEAAGVKLREMKRRKETTFCCGAGGSNYWYKVPQQSSIAGIRAEEARRTGAKTVSTECPFCLSMLDDATKVTGDGLEVKDVAEIVAENMI